MIMSEHRPIPAKVVRAFRRAIDIELSVNRDREQEQDRYRNILFDIAAWLKLDICEIGPLGLDGQVCPEWIRRFDELSFWWERSHRALLERQGVMRHFAERRRLRSA
jgi:hypothetical protein